MRAFRMFFILGVLLAVILHASAQKKSDYNSRKVDNAVNKLSESTRKRILAMQNNGMSKDAIAKKIQYEVGSVSTARKMMEKINVEESKKDWSHKQKQRYLGKERVMKQQAESVRKAMRRKFKSGEL